VQKQSPEVSTKYLRAFAIFKHMRTTADIAAIITIALMAIMIKRKDSLLNAQRRANAMLMKSNGRLMKKLDDVLLER
jgi:hypothetical protein